MTAYNKLARRATHANADYADDVSWQIYEKPWSLPSTLVEKGRRRRHGQEIIRWPWRFFCRQEKVAAFISSNASPEKSCEVKNLSALDIR